MLASGFAANIIAVNPVTNKIYVGCFALSPDDEEPGGQFQVSAPLVVVDGATGATTILSEDLWTDLQVNAVTNTVYGADGGTAIIVVDGTTNAVTRVPTPAAVYEVCVNPVTNAVYGVGGQNVVTVVDGTTHAVSEVVVGGDANGIAVNTVTNQVFVSNGNENYVTVIDGSTLTATEVDIGSPSGAMAVNGATGQVYVAGSRLMVIDGKTLAAAPLAPISGVYAVAVNPVNNKIYTANFSTASVTEIDGATGAESTIPVGAHPASLAVNPVTNQIFVTSGDNGALTVIDGSSNAVVAVYSTGGSGIGWFPLVDIGPALNPVTNTAYVPVSTGLYAVVANAAPGIPIFISEPASQTLSPGKPAALAAFAGSTASTAYRWLKDGIPVSDGGGTVGSSTSTLFIARGANSADTGLYSCVATNSVGSAGSNEVALSVASTGEPGRLINLSARGVAGNDASALIAGFVTSGPAPKTLLVRAVGPTLSTLGVAGALAGPVLSLYDGSSPANFITGDSGWQNPPSPPQGPWYGKAAPVDGTAADFAQVGAFTLIPGSHDSAIKITLPSGAYTGAVINGEAGGPGVALAEVYDADAGDPQSQLINISARASVGTGANILIAGFVISGDTSQTVLVRAAGPALGKLGVAGLLPDPLLQIFDGNKNLLASNAAWGGSAPIASAASTSGAFSWGDVSSNDAAVLITLPPGSYTAQASGAVGDMGTALVEVYAVPALP
jgi:DNA-binding beta-propeller fold protein YncE